MNSRRAEFWNAIAFLQVYARKKGIRLMPIWFHRTVEEQRALFEKGKSKCDGKKNKSKHQDWLAMDLVVLDENNIIKWEGKEYKILGDYWEKRGHRWGGNFSGLYDPYHFEL